jgi:hypothetical protein
LPEKFIINHNDLSDFSRYFFPYIALVVDPKKRESKKNKSNNKSKFGTYLRYKRVTKYDNRAKLEQKIIFFMRNYEFQNDKLAAELAKQFNITDEIALDTIKSVKERYPNIKKSRKVLKKLDELPKYSPPGIGIDIQGKQRDNYKVRITGARSRKQLDLIISFMNVLLNLYIETYLYKKKDRQKLKDKLKLLTHIAKRRKKVDVMVDHTKEKLVVKKMAKIDKQRLGFKPEKGQHQWSRACQNSGTDKRRRPQQYNSSNMNELLKLGYKYDKKEGLYIKKFKKGKKEITLKTIKLPEYNENGEKTGNNIHYSCDPELNGIHMYVGFLTRSRNPFGHCMPCCFKKNPATSNNKVKRKFFETCLIQGESKKENIKVTPTTGDKLYILQDTNKIQDGRVGFLPKYLDRYFNSIMENTIKIKNHYLQESLTGYYLKYGSNQQRYQFLNAIGASLDMDIKQIREKIINSLEGDKTNQLFTSLNNGDIKTQFESIENYVDFIKESLYLDYPIVKDIIRMPGVLTKNGLNIIIFHKKEVIIKRTLERDRIVEDFYLECVDQESNFTINEPEYLNVILMRDDKNYYPIVMIKKKDKKIKEMDIVKSFKFDNNEKNVIKHLSNFFNKNCSGIEKSINNKIALNAKQTNHILQKLNREYQPRYQIIDNRNKCKYFVSNNNMLIPIRPSGSLWDIQIIKTFDKYISNFENTYNNLMKIYKISEKKIVVKPVGVYYEKKKGNILDVNSIYTKTKDIVPIIPIKISIDKLNKYKLTYEKKPLFDTIDKVILKGRDNKKVDKRIMKVNENIFIEESYQLFRLELSNYLSKLENEYYRKRIQNIIADKKLHKLEKVDKIRLLLYRIIDKSLYNKYNELISKKNKNNNQTGGNLSDNYNISDNININIQKLDELNLENSHHSLYNPYGSTNSYFQVGGKINKLIQKTTKLQDIVNYKVDNERKVCEIHNDKNLCNSNPHCKWTNNKCYMKLTIDMIVMFVNRISEELAHNDIKAYEILRIDNYYVSDIVDRNNFKKIPGQRIIRESASNIKNILKDIFGSDNIPNIGKRNTKNTATNNYLELNNKNPLQELRDIYVQRIIPNNMTVIRAYSNCYYWLNNEYYDTESRNLGFYSKTQTQLTNNFISMIIKWLTEPYQKENITKELIKHMEVKLSSKDPINEFINRLINYVETITEGIAELTILSIINKDMPIIIRDITDNIIYIINKGKLNSKPTKKDTDKLDFKKCIILRYEYISKGSVPYNVESIYYK